MFRRILTPGHGQFKAIDNGRAALEV